MYSTSRITDGNGMEKRDECSHCEELSSARATPFRISTTARRAVQTLIGSNEALRTKTREFILESKYNLGVMNMSKTIACSLPAVFRHRGRACRDVWLVDVALGLLLELGPNLLAQRCVFKQIDHRRGKRLGCVSQSLMAD